MEIGQNTFEYIFELKDTKLQVPALRLKRVIKRSPFVLTMNGQRLVMEPFGFIPKQVGLFGTFK